MAYIICERRRGHPKVNVEVCRRKCRFQGECKSYQKYTKTVGSEDASLAVKGHTPSLSRTEGVPKEIHPA
ncbi:MAG: hypothetical protein JRH07_02970 [Deltaproteobacteria bacterium]|nr:hypothetical protein [Deltaproteobacteria bacterium]